MADPVQISGITQDTGSSDSDGITADNTLKISGVGIAGSKITVRDGTKTLGTVTVNGSGHWTFDYTSHVLTDGNHSLTAKDNANHTSSAFVVTVDTNIAAPTFDRIVTDSGASNSDFITSNFLDISLEGTAEANSVVEAYVDGTSVGTTTADASGHYGLLFSPSGDATYSVKIAATDVAGNSRFSTVGIGASEFTMDGSAPATPTIIDGLSIDSGASSSDEITNDNTPTFAGSAEANSIVSVYVDGSLVGTTTASGSGAWSFTIPTPDWGAHNLTVKATDIAGNTSGASSALPFTIDTSAPPTPQSLDLAAADDTAGASTSDNITFHDTALTVSGTAEVNSLVTVYDDGTPLTTVTATGGNWSVDLNLSEGVHNITADATDAAGNVSSVSSDFAVTVDTTAPAAPVVTGIEDDTGSSSSDGHTSDTTLTINGTAEANSIVQVSQDAGGGPVGIGTVTADGSGNWSINTGTLAGNTFYAYRATATDLAGNTSAASSPEFDVFVDTAPPNEPNDNSADSDAVAENVTNGTFAGITAFASDNDASSTYSLSDDAGGRFAIDSLTGDVTVANASLINFETATSHNITVVATDLSGNTNSHIFAIAVTNVAPGTPSDTNAAANQVNEHASNGTTVGLTAFASDPHGGDIVYSLIGDADGRFTINPTTGVVTVADGTFLDFDTDTSHDITVEADDGGAQTTQVFTINVLDVVGVTIIGSKNADTIDDDETAPGQPLPTFEGDTIFGMKGNDSIFGLGGADILDGGAGNDDLHGGDGNDTFVVNGLTNYLTDVFHGDGDTDRILVTGTTDVALGGFNSTAAEIETWTGNNHGLIGTAANETFDLTGLTTVTGLLFVNGGAGNDTLNGSNADNNDLRGGAGNDALFGGNLDDILTGGAGADQMFGGTGNDTFVIAKTDGVGDLIDGSADIDTLQATGKVTLNGFDAGNSQIEQWVGLANNSVTGTIAGDTFNFSALTSMTGLLFVDGGKGDDLLIGSNFVDTLKGGDGNDSLVTSAGNDFMTGGKGVDQFYANTGDGVDTVTDYKGGEDTFNVGRAGFTDYGDVQAAMTQINNNHDVQIDFGGGDMLIIQKTTIAFLNAHSGDFIFV